MHRHTLMTMIAYAYLQSRRLAEASGGKESAKGRPPRSGAPCSPFSLARRQICEATTQWLVDGIAEMIECFTKQEIDSTVDSLCVFQVVNVYS
jgi:hypothetical protein